MSKEARARTRGRVSARSIVNARLKLIARAREIVTRT